MERCACGACAARGMCTPRLRCLSISRSPATQAQCSALLGVMAVAVAAVAAVAAAAVAAAAAVMAAGAAAVMRV